VADLIAEYDQVKAEALEAVRRFDGNSFILAWVENADTDIAQVTSLGLSRVDHAIPLLVSISVRLTGAEPGRLI
jgi:hypothetical protein